MDDKGREEVADCKILGFCWNCGSEEKMLVSTHTSTVTCLTCNHEHALVYFRQPGSEQAKIDELFSRLWQLHFKIEGFYSQMPTTELKEAIGNLCDAMNYCFCLHAPSIDENRLKDKLVGKQ